MRSKVAVLAIFAALISVFIPTVLAFWWAPAPPKVTIPVTTQVETIVEVTLTGTWSDYPILRDFCNKVFSVGDNIYGTRTGTGWVDKYVVTLTKAKTLRIGITFYSGNTGFIKWMNGAVNYIGGSTDSWISSRGTVVTPTLYLQPGKYEFLVGFTQSSRDPVPYLFKMG